MLSIDSNIEHCRQSKLPRVYKENNVRNIIIARANLVNHFLDLRAISDREFRSKMRESKPIGLEATGITHARLYLNTYLTCK